MMDSLISMYRRGALTADHLLLECLQRINPAEPGLVLGSLPDELLGRMHDLVNSCRPDDMVTNYGPLPAVDQIQAAKQWIESTQNAVASRSTPDS